MNFREITTCSKLQVPEIMYGYQINRKSSVSKINVACSSTNLYCEPWHVRNPDIFIIRGNQNPGIFKSSTVFRYL